MVRNYIMKTSNGKKKAMTKYGKMFKKFHPDDDVNLMCLFS